MFRVIEFLEFNLEIEKKRRLALISISTIQKFPALCKVYLQGALHHIN